jgi:hypothetical protein
MDPVIAVSGRVAWNLAPLTGGEQHSGVLDRLFQQPAVGSATGPHRPAPVRVGMSQRVVAERVRISQMYPGRLVVLSLPRTRQALGTQTARPAIWQGQGSVKRAVRG